MCWMVGSLSQYMAHFARVFSTEVLETILSVADLVNKWKGTVHEKVPRTIQRVINHRNFSF